MRRFLERHPLWSLVSLVAVAVLLWLILAPWPPGMVEAFGRKKVFLNALFNGITLGALYFLVASGFTLIFGLMRNIISRTDRCISWGGTSATRSPSGPARGSRAS